MYCSLSFDSNYREFLLTPDTDFTVNSENVQKHLTQNETRRSGVAPITSNSELAIARKTDSKTTKVRKSVNSAQAKPVKRGSGKSAKAWK